MQFYFENKLYLLSRVEGLEGFKSIDYRIIK